MNHSEDKHLDTKFQKLPPIRRWTKFPNRVWEVTGTKTVRDWQGNIKEVNTYSSRPATEFDSRRRENLRAQMTGGM